MQYHGSPVWEQMTVDNWYHHHWAQSIADGNVLGDTTYFRAPLYVYCLGALYFLFGSSFWVGRLFGLTIGLASIGMTYVLGRRALGRWEALVAAALHALLPIVIYFEAELLLDPLFTLLLQVAVWRFLVWMESEQRVDLFWAGLAFGLASICRPTALIVAALALFWIVLKRPSERRHRGFAFTLGRAALFAVGLVLCVGPILVRNLAVAGDPVLIASQGGINFYIGNNPTSDGLSATLPEPMGYNWRIKQITHLAEVAEKRVLKPGEVSSYWQKQAIDWIRSHPGDFAALTLRKMIFLMGNQEVPNERSIETHYAAFPILGRIRSCSASSSPLPFWDCGILAPEAGHPVCSRDDGGLHVRHGPVFRQQPFPPAAHAVLLPARRRRDRLDLEFYSAALLAAGGRRSADGNRRVAQLRSSGKLSRRLVCTESILARPVPLWQGAVA